MTLADIGSEPTRVELFRYARCAAGHRQSAVRAKSAAPNVRHPKRRKYNCVVKLAGHRCVSVPAPGWALSSLVCRHPLRARARFVRMRTLAFAHEGTQPRGRRHGLTRSAPRRPGWEGRKRVFEPGKALVPVDVLAAADDAVGKRDT